ncbi:MAG: SRPBCC family protein, partial [Chloroflexota bacterium]|nr:SRPBCC family protein [Chloroflexota bacterium]
FEEFPQFMEGVKQVRQLDDKTLEWTAEIGGNEETWRAEISEQEPDQRIAWHSIEGAPNAGAVTFHRIDDNTTRIMLQMEFEPRGALESAGDALGVPERRVEGDLKRFKEFIESRGAETGAWRGRIEQTQVR